MCGLAGILDLGGQPVSPNIIRKMIKAIEHRGPDDEGIYNDGFFGVGHRRLAIVDLSRAGHQPMEDRLGRYVLAYNGEIYNFQELRAELETLGHVFRSKTDTEVVLNCLVQWGAQAFSKFNGMFALAFWDKKERRLLLGRDRYGIKPLYYCTTQGKFIFGSEVKAILATPTFRVEMDKEALVEYLTFQNFFTDKTLYKDIKMFPPGYYGVVEANHGGLKLGQYWDFHFGGPDQERTKENYFEELDFLLKQAVNRQLVADVEIGSFLSGGLDSGSITALAAGQLPYIKTFTVGFDLKSASGIELTFDEREKAEFMSYLFKTEHYEMVLKSGDMERVLPDLVNHLEEPRVGQSYPNFYACKLASKFCKVVLSGTGGDEIFGGYPWRYYRCLGSSNFEDFIDRYYTFWHRVVPNSALQKLLSPIRHETAHIWTRDIFRDVFKQRPTGPMNNEDYIHHSMYLEAKTFLHGLLIVEDKYSMAHSMETRLPFLDNDLVDFGLRLPLKYKLNNLEQTQKINENQVGDKKASYFLQTKDGKKILREVVGQFAPMEIINANKQGFSAPDSSWFKGESIAYLKGIIFNKNARIYDYLERSTVQALVGEHLDGLDNKRLFIWCLIYIENWLKRYVS